MKKKLIGILLCGLFSSNVFCQFATDAELAAILAQIESIKANQISGYLAAIDTLYEAYDQAERTVKMIEQNYEQMQFYLERAKSWNFQEVEWNGDLDFRDEFRNATSQVNRQLNNIRNAKNAFTRSNISINGNNYSLQDICGMGNTRNGTFGSSFKSFVQDCVDEQKSYIDQAYEAAKDGITVEEEKKFWAKYGLSPKNYMMVKAVEVKAEEVIKEALGWAEEENIEAEYAHTTELIKNITKMIENSGGENELTETELAQINSMLQMQTITALKDLEIALKKGVSYEAWFNQLQKNEDAAKEQQQQDLANEANKRHINRSM